jgi:hypothetical protein
MITQLERLTRVEVEVQALKESLEDYKIETNIKLEKMNDKLDALLVLRNKGAGVLWILSGLAVIVLELYHYVWSK